MKRINIVRSQELESFRNRSLTAESLKMKLGYRFCEGVVRLVFPSRKCRESLA